MARVRATAADDPHPVVGRPNSRSTRCDAERPRATVHWLHREPACARSAEHPLHGVGTALGRLRGDPHRRQLHIGSSSNLPTTSADAPFEVLLSVNTINSTMALCDWVLSGILERHQGLRVALSEGQVGWIPYYAMRMDQLWEANMYNHMQSWLSRRPSEYLREHVYGCIFDDPVGLRNRELVGMSQIMIETDFPHGDSTYPNSKALVEKIVAEAELNDHETWQLVHEQHDQVLWARAIRHHVVVEAAQPQAN